MNVVIIIITVTITITLVLILLLLLPLMLLLLVLTILCGCCVSKNFIPLRLAGLKFPRFGKKLSAILNESLTTETRIHFGLHAYWRQIAHYCTNFLKVASFYNIVTMATKWGAHHYIESSMSPPPPPPPHTHTHTLVSIKGQSFRYRAIMGIYSK